MSIKSALVGAAVLAALFLALMQYGRAQHRQGYELAQAENRAALVQAQARARVMEQQLQKEVDDVRANFQNQLDVARDAAVAARTDLDSLRGKLAAANDRVATQAARAGHALDENARIAAELRNVVGMCAARYTELAQHADAYRSTLNAWQGYALSVRR